MDSHFSAAVAAFSTSVVPLVERFQLWQTGTGSVAPEHAADAARALTRLGDAVAGIDEGLFAPGFAAAFRADCARWLEAGLDTPPLFDGSRDAVVAPADGALAGFVGPVFLPNSGNRAPLLQAFVVRRQEPDATPFLNATFPHPLNMCQSTQVVAGTPGVVEGDCVVFFPENIAAAEPVAAQRFAWFFFDKHRRIYPHTLRLVHEAAPDGPFPPAYGELRSPRLAPDDIYEARCIWGYLHDYHHHNGPRPFNENLALKTQWIPGMLEEIKVDSQSAIACLTTPGLPFGPEIFEYVVLERLFRYPVEPDRSMNADSATGVLLAAWLLREGALRLDDGTARLAMPEAVVAALRSLVAAIEELERLPDDGYLAAAERFAFELLAPPAAEPARYAVPDALADLTMWPRLRSDAPVAVAS